MSGGKCQVMILYGPTCTPCAELHKSLLVPLVPEEFMCREIEIDPPFTIIE